MQIIGSGQIVTLVTSVVPAFFSCIALFICFFCLALLLLLLYSLECAGGFRSCGSDHGLCPLDSHKPLKRLDRNFKCFGAVTFVPYFRRGCFVSVLTKFGRVPQKIKTAPHETYCSARCCCFFYFLSILENCYYCAVIVFFDICLYVIRLECAYECLDLWKVFIAASYCNDVCICLCCVA